MLRTLLGPTGSDRRMYSLLALAVVLMPVGCLVSQTLYYGATMRDVMSVGVLGAMAAVGIGTIVYGMVTMVLDGVRGTTPTLSVTSSEDRQPEQPSPAPQNPDHKLAA